MSEFIKVGSRSPVPLRLTETAPYPDKPGLNPELRSVVINAAGHPDSPLEGITENVDAGLFRAWMRDNDQHPAVVNGLLREIPVGAPEEQLTFGFQPELDRALAEQAPEDQDKASEDEAASEAGKPAPAPSKPSLLPAPAGKPAQPVPAASEQTSTGAPSRK